MSTINPNSLLFNQLSPSERSDSLTNGIFYFSHSYAVGVKTFDDNENLRNFWDLSAQTIAIKDSEEFSVVAAVEAKKYPFFGTQFHP